jgi:hypothetical protein
MNRNYRLIECPFEYRIEQIKIVGIPGRCGGERDGITSFADSTAISIEMSNEFRLDHFPFGRFRSGHSICCPKTALIP